MPGPVRSVVSATGPEAADWAVLLAVRGDPDQISPYGRAPAMSTLCLDLSDDPTSWPETYLRWLYRVPQFRPPGIPRWQPAGSADGCWP